MKKCFHILCSFLIIPFFLHGQDTLSIQTEKPILEIGQDSLLLNPEEIPEILSDSIDIISSDSIGINQDSTTVNPLDKYSSVSIIDTTFSINYWNITRRTGEIFPVVPDTFLTDYFNRTVPEGAGISISYLGNLGLPMESRVFFDREDRSQFMFMDPYWYYAKQPDKFNFVNTKIPYTNVSYQRAGSRDNMEERLQATLAINSGKKLNFGLNLDYLYARGFYNSQGSKHIEWVFFGNYISDKHQVHLFINPADYTNGENGGIADDDYISRPEQFTITGSKVIPTNFIDTWNHLKGNRYYLNYHYNLGFERKTTQVDEEGNEIKEFIPVSSIIYTFDYENRKRRFYTQDPTSLDTYFNNIVKNEFFFDERTNDSTSYNSMSNTVALSLREGFNELAKFDLTAFITQDVRNYTLMDSIYQEDNDSVRLSDKTRQFATYIGGELSKKTGKILTYNAQGSIGIAGDNQGDINLSGKIETKIPLFNQYPSLTANAYFKDLSPTFYENNFHSKYYWWRNNFSKTKKVFIGGAIDFPLTNTNLSLGVENLTNYVYFDETGNPNQHSGNIQIMAATLKQNFQVGKLKWDNQLVYQTCSEQNILPLPDFAVYTSLYLDFKVAGVLTIQMGANMHFWTEYYSPTYNPATQQFMLQKENEKIKIGNYPLICGFINCHLKQARFFVQYYNAGSSFVNPPEYFSLPHYPVNPTVLKLGISVDFIN